MNSWKVPRFKVHFDNFFNKTIRLNRFGSNLKLTANVYSDIYHGTVQLK